jgi:hypothetical protein
MTQEKDIQTAANEAAHDRIADMREQLDALNAARESDDSEGEDAAREEIYQSPLSIQVREGWHSVGEEGEIEEFEILLGTGGPASRIVGTLDEYSQPASARYEYQDWFKPWTAANDLTSEEVQTLKSWAAIFYFGE